MAASSSMNPLIYFLVKHGKTLASLLREAKSQPNFENSTIIREAQLKIIHDKVREEVHQVLEKLECLQLPGSFPAYVITKILEKIQVTLQKFSKLDTHNASNYEELAKIINDSKFKKQSPAEISSSVPDETQLNKASPSYTYDDLQHDDFEDMYANLSDTEQKCLFCFCMFSAESEIKKRELIYWWTGMDLLDDPLQGDETLAKLVAEEIIERIIKNKRLCNRYKMNTNVCSKVQAVSSFKSIEQRESWSIMSQQPQPQLIGRKISSLTSFRTISNELLQQDDKNMSCTLVLNISENSLNMKTFEWLNKMKCVKVLHLGSWHQNPKRYIVVEDDDTLKALRHMGHVAFLSLQGISGIVELPDSVYKLENLKVLDLRACSNLESLSEGVESLKQLTHLDLSECYLLDHIPQGIAFLTKLRVLKGFVINPEVPYVGNDKNASSSASFSDLSNLKELIKLTIRTRIMNFPTTEDLDTLYDMKKLINLRIAWVWISTDMPSADASGRLPASLKKLELQAAPENTMSRLLSLISEDTQNSLEKLYIRGGQHRNLGMELNYLVHVNKVRLRYLPEIRIDWDEFKKFFPKLTRLEVSGCPNLLFFPCDENGVWENT